MRSPLVLISLFLIALVSCKKDTQVLDVGYEYFPETIGKYVIYEGDSIIYDEEGNAPHDTIRFQVKEVIESIYTDNQGRPTMRIERYKKMYNDTLPYNNMPWILSDVWAANRTSTTAERVEENVRFIKLIFPVKEDQSWNGNAQNTLEEWPYEITSAHESETVNNLSFDSVAVVLQNDDENLVERKYGVEKYARDIGLIYKEYLVLDKQKKDSLDFPPFDDTTGIWYRLKVIGYGP
jgi:hypothetical protein